MADILNTDIAELCQGITDQALLNKIDSLIKQPIFEGLIEEISKGRDNSFSDRDKRVLVQEMLNAPGTSREKTNFLRKTQNDGILDAKKMLAPSNSPEVKNIDDFLPTTLSTSDKAIYKFLAERIGGQRNPFDLGSAATVGAGEGFLIFMCKDVTKGAVGDLAYKGKDWEIKAQGARWHSARVAGKSMSMIKVIMTKILKKSNPEVTEQAVRESIDWRVNTLTNRDDVEKLGVTVDQYCNAMADTLQNVFPRGADVSGFRNTQWVINPSKQDRVKAFRSAFSRAVGSHYQNSDGWAYITQFNPDKMKILTMRNADEIAAAMEDGKLKMSHAMVVDGGNSGRDMSPQYSI